MTDNLANLSTAAWRGRPRPLVGAFLVGPSGRQAGAGAGWCPPSRTSCSAGTRRRWRQPRSERASIAAALPAAVLVISRRDKALAAVAQADAPAAYQPKE
jgi:hypothetical protein